VNATAPLFGSLSWRAARAAVGSDGDKRTGMLRRQLDSALGKGGYLNWEEAFGFASAAEDILGDLDTMLDEGNATEVVALARHALELIAQTLGHTLGTPTEGWSTFSATPTRAADHPDEAQALRKRPGGHQRARTIRWSCVIPGIGHRR
jgi:hypothetical protein